MLNSQLRVKKKKRKKKLKSSSYRSTKHFHTLSCLKAIITIWSLAWLYSLLIWLSANVEFNPGLKRVSVSNMSICHWNLNSFSARNYTKLFLLKAYIAIHKFDIICLSESCVYFSTTFDDDFGNFRVQLNTLWSPFQQ